MKIEDMSPKLLKAIKSFAQTSTKGGCSVSISVNGGKELKIDKETADRIKRNVDGELDRRLRVPHKR
jgi:hypothetical protein